MRRPMRRLDNIDIRLLRVFTALADAQGFAQAQISLNLSQSTLSTHLAELEKRIGGQLCHRGRHKFKLTELGNATYDASMKLFRELDEFTQRISAANGNLAGNLRIGTCDGVVFSPQLSISRAIEAFLPPESEVFIDLALGNATELERGIADGERDIVIGPLSQRVPGVEYVEYCAEPHQLYCGKGHPLFSTPDERIDRKAVESAKFSVRKYRHLDDLFRVGQARAGASIVAMEAHLMLLLSGRYIGFLPTHLAEHWVSIGDLRPLMTETYSFDSQHSIGYRRQAVGSTLVDMFLEVLLRQRDQAASAARHR